MPLDCLGFLNGSYCPHSETERRPTFQKYILTGKMQGGYAADDGVALHFVGTKLLRAVSSHPNAIAYYVTNHGEQLEQEIETFYLG
jgi:dipeptidase E